MFSFFQIWMCRSCGVISSKSKILQILNHKPEVFLTLWFNYYAMKVLLVMVGKTSEKWLQQGIEQYVKRLGHYVPFEIKVLPDIKNGGKIKSESLKQLEGESIFKTLNATDQLILLDENGREYSSREFSGFLEKEMISSARRLVFVIGGAWGFSEDVYKRAKLKISLSRMTFSHQMVRLIFTEQLYRALTILKNEPYHHD